MIAAAATIGYARYSKLLMFAPILEFRIARLILFEQLAHMLRLLCIANDGQFANKLHCRAMRFDVAH